MLALVLAGALTAATPPADQALIFYNARLALRDKKPTEVLKLWLLRNTVANHRDQHDAHDAEFQSLVWAALGELGLCQDGFPKDEGGAGLWPLAFHNWVVRNMGYSPVTQPPPFDTFDIGRQQRFISLHDVLSQPELRSVTFFRSSCLMPRAMMTRARIPPWSDLKDRQRVARLLRYLLVLSRSTLVADKVENRAAIEARLFDLDLAITDLAAKEARQKARAAGREAKNLGVSAAAVAEMKDAAKPFTFPPGSEQARLLERSLAWPAAEWLSLTRERRLFLFAQARKLSTDAAALDALMLAVIDGLTERKAGGEIEEWIGFFDASDAARRSAVFMGERGERLLGLERETGFRERAVVALHRGVGFLEAGDLGAALTSFAYAMQRADESREANTVLAMGRRWLSYVLSRYQTSDEVIATLWALVPRQEYNLVIEDLAWRAALGADAASFALSTRNAKGSSAFVLRMHRLRPLALGRLGDFATELRDALASEPHITLRFLRQLVERLEAEDGDVRQAHTKTLGLLVDLVEPLAGAKGAQGRTAEALVARCHAMLEGIESLTPREATRDLSPTSEVFAGNIRLAPADPLPWPFFVPEPQSPSAFTTIALVPLEWRDAHGDLVFGWRITE